MITLETGKNITLEVKNINIEMTVDKKITLEVITNPKIIEGGSIERIKAGGPVNITQTGTNIYFEPFEPETTDYLVGIIKCVSIDDPDEELGVTVIYKDVNYFTVKSYGKDGVLEWFLIKK